MQAPGARRFLVGESGEITKVGRASPLAFSESKLVPACGMAPARPQPHSGLLSSRVPVRIVRAGHEQPANLLLTTLVEWAA